MIGTHFTRMGTKQLRKQPAGDTIQMAHSKPACAQQRTRRHTKKPGGRTGHTWTQAAYPAADIQSKKQGGTPHGPDHTRALRPPADRQRDPGRDQIHPGYIPEGAGPGDGI